MQIQGEIQKISDDRKTIKINNNLFRSFIALSDDFGNGNIVDVKYSEKKVNDKIFKNINSIVKVIPTKEQNYIKEPRKIDSTTVNCLIMQSREYAADKGIKLKEAAKEMMEVYEEIISRV